MFALGDVILQRLLMDCGINRDRSPPMPGPATGCCPAHTRQPDRRGRWGDVSPALDGRITTAAKSRQTCRADRTLRPP